MKHNQKACPLSEKRIEKTAKGGRRKYSCESCGSTINKILALGKLPYSCTGVKQELQRAANAAGLGHLSTHVFRHTYRTWLDSVGTPVGVQQKLMRHADIRTTMNIYGDAVTPDMREAHGKIVGLALSGTESARKGV